LYQATLNGSEDTDSFATTGGIWLKWIDSFTLTWLLGLRSEKRHEKKAGNCVFQTRCEQVILCLERCITFRLIVPHEYIQNETVSVQTYIIPTDTLH